MKIGDSVIVTWAYFNNSIKIGIKIGDIGIIKEINNHSFQTIFNLPGSTHPHQQGFYINNDQNGYVKYKKYNYRQEKLERILSVR